MKEKFNTSFARCDYEIRARHGKIWSDSEYETLRKLYMGGANLREMAEQMRRPADGVVVKLRQLGLIEFDTASTTYYRLVTPNVIQAPQPETETTKEEPTMATKNIETKVFIQGEDASQLSDAQIFVKIAQIEGKIEGLNKIVAKPKKLEAVIVDMHADIAKLVAYVDARP